MPKEIHRADARGIADHGWLQARHSFSFAGYYNPKRIGFGLLRVFNDDTIAPGKGFSTHPHDNMEIVTIPLVGAVRHRDSMDNEGVIRAGEVQRMSAGSGVTHSEFNASETEPLNLFQIWVYPAKHDIAPIYEQKAFSEDDRRNTFQCLVSPDGRQGSLSINQNVLFSRVALEKNKRIGYDVQYAKNGLYIMVISGQIRIGDANLGHRDAIAFTETPSVTLTAAESADILVVDVPMA